MNPLGFGLFLLDLPKLFELAMPIELADENRISIRLVAPPQLGQPLEVAGGNLVLQAPAVTIPSATTRGAVAPAHDRADHADPRARVHISQRHPHADVSSGLPAEESGLEA